MLLVTKGIATRNKRTLLVAPGLTTSSKKLWSHRVVMKCSEDVRRPHALYGLHAKCASTSSLCCDSSALVCRVCEHGMRARCGLRT